MYPGIGNATVQTNIVILLARANGAFATVDVKNHQKTEAYQLLMSFDPLVAQYIFDSNKAAYAILEKLLYSSHDKVPPA